ncbi:lysine exporter LysO family protein [Escherichia coli]|nr:lysine exporter LysO family protein [Escherichia coli]
MFSGLLIIQSLIVVTPIRQAFAPKLFNRTLDGLILFSLPFLDNLASNLLAILHYSAVSITVILLCNIAALMWLERGLPWRNHHQQEKLPSRIAMALESLKLCGVVVIGFAIGLSGPINLSDSSIILINAFILDLPINTALAMASGFGWYSLSGILLTESFGPVIGSAAFFNDLARELIAIMLIPGLIRRSRSTALGLCGATSMDFTLPVLQRTGGLDMVPAAIVHGFILSLLVPILIAFFSA